MSERDKAHIAGWAVGALTMIAIGLASWTLLQCNALGIEQARAEQKACNTETLLQEVRQDVKEIMRRLPQK
jgi:sensor domain CHASE-containing protein